MLMDYTYYAAVFLPLLGFLIAGLGGYRLGQHGAEYLTTGFMLVAAVLSVLLFRDIALMGNERIISLGSWISFGNFKVDWALRFDTLTAVMLVVVNVVSAMVHLYSIGYMHDDPHRPRFFAYLSLFTFMMLMLVTANNLLQMFFGWEGVGLASYLLINFWFQKPSANAASIKAFLVNRVGDFGFALGIMGIFILYGSLDFSVIFAATAPGAGLTFFGQQVDALFIVCLLLFIGAMGKSAQLGLHTWLPDAMEGPTPVSALIHAATMVTAGIFMLCRLSPVFEQVPDALHVVAIVGALTAFVAATIGLTQWDIKRVIAYSTMSQLGYMFFAIGVSAYSAAMFHLMTHAFFKALLFLGAGSVIHAMSGEQDMRKMGGIWKKIPTTYGLMWIGSLALAGMPFFAGFYSKDMVLEAAWASQTMPGHIAFWLGCAAALMTAFYSWRLLILTFHGKPRADAHTMDHVHESPFVMLLPLGILAIGALFAGWYAYDWFVGEGRAEFWRATIAVTEGRDTVEAAHHVPAWVKLLPVALGLTGILLAYIVYSILPGLAGRISGSFKALYQLFFNKWWFDELYNALIVQPSLALGQSLWKKGDGAFIDGLGPNGMAALTAGSSRNLLKLQTGYLYHYAFAMVLALIALIGWFIWHAPISAFVSALVVWSK